MRGEIGQAETSQAVTNQARQAVTSQARQGETSQAEIETNQANSAAWILGRTAFGAAQQQVEETTATTRV